MCDRTVRIFVGERRKEETEEKDGLRKVVREKLEKSDCFKIHFIQSNSL